MHYYTQADQVAEMQARIRELEEEKAASDLVIAALFDDVDASKGREQRLLWTALAFGTLMVAAIVQLAAGR